MDARQRRTRENLRRAIYDLASLRPVGALTVSEIAREAGVTRDTFYRHAASPEDLLASVLEEELAGIEPPARSTADEFVRAEIDLVRHVAAHAPLYRAALVDGRDGHLRDVLHRVIATRLDEYLAANPDVVPPVPDGMDAAGARAVWVAYAAAGTVGAIAQWLRSGAGDTSIEPLARTIIAGHPAWWHLPAAAADPAAR
ncbi:TetR/AcrR family transcriptional regulator [Microbacterium thalassium]|uniref:AcrR family transcriptional regulator n=1 Tax=Microbacterium thalassium TaxID=362649 RepID=A0A7X0FNB3_9MICO|nr:TetR/AcrR family transcriptional regulator [Microbacterium thalassium]MBB6390142.1 AcrR family transcriptional regulator [Microbacterium thalassium]GLK25250.1 hypothetical protein GCM10017607_25690 [Microbacterium thalassium]